MYGLAQQPQSWPTFFFVCLIHLGLFIYAHQTAPEPSTALPALTLVTQIHPQRLPEPTYLPSPPENKPTQSTITPHKALAKSVAKSVVQTPSAIKPALVAGVTVATVPDHPSPLLPVAVSTTPNTTPVATPSLTQPRVQGIATRIRSPLKGRVSVTVLISPQNQPLHIHTAGMEPQLYAHARRLAEGGRYQTALREGVPIEASVTFDILFN